jgi:bifunctional polynucleotide phosphatase/kinase
MILDDINIDTKSRKVWLTLAQKYGLQARALHFTTPTELCLHNDSFRALGGIQVGQFKPFYHLITTEIVQFR